MGKSLRRGLRSGLMKPFCLDAIQDDIAQQHIGCCIENQDGQRRPASLWIAQFEAVAIKIERKDKTQNGTDAELE